MNWRLIGFPRPTSPERLTGAVGLRVVRLPRRAGRVVLVAGSVEHLRHLLTEPAALAPARHVLIVVAWWRAPRRDWCGRVGSLDHLRRYRVSLPAGGRGVARVSMSLSKPARLRDLVAAALPALHPTRPLPAPASAEVTAQGVLPAYLPIHRTQVLVGELAQNLEIRAHDLLLRPGGPPPPDPPAAEPLYAAVYDSTSHVVHAPTGPVILVDAERVNAIGRRASCYEPDAARVLLEFGPVARAPKVGDSIVLRGSALDARTVARLRRVGRVGCPRLPDTEPVATATLLVQLAMTGVVLDVPALPPGVADLLDPELRTLLSARPGAADALGTEARSVRQRRAALRGHAAGFALPNAAGATFPGLARPPSVSAVLLTRRPAMLPAALHAIAAQTYPELEIVVGLHGVELPAELRARLHTYGRPITIVPIPAGTGFGEALGMATGQARGSLVTKFDDDDTYGPEHVWDLVLARHYSGANLVGKGAEFVFLEALGTTVRRRAGVPESDAEVVAGGTMLISRGDLEAVGGWRPVPRSVDRGLIDRIKRDGGRIYRTHPLGYVYHRRAGGHTWDAGEDYFLDTAYARWEGLPPHAEFGADAAPALTPLGARRS